MTENRTAIIVGGAGGIGSAVCQHLATNGYRVVVADLLQERASAVTATLAGSHHGTAQLDVTDSASVECAFAEIERDSPAAVLVVASGGTFVDPRNVPDVAATSAADWARTIALNLSGVFNCVSHFTRHRQARPLANGRIILFSSGSGQMGGTPTGVAYASAKAALLGLTRHVAFELAASGITVNAIAPGPIGTPELFRVTSEEARAALSAMTPLGRFGTPAEVAACVAYLASPEAAFITGATVDINGGARMQ